MDRGQGCTFVDDLTLRAVVGGREDPREEQADEWAEAALIPRAIWDTSAVRDRPTPMAVMNLATAMQVHPAIVAGRIRYEQRNYRLLSQFVGTGEVRRQFGVTAAASPGHWPRRPEDRTDTATPTKLTGVNVIGVDGYMIHVYHVDRRLHGSILRR